MPVDEPPRGSFYFDDCHGMSSWKLILQRRSTSLQKPGKWALLLWHGLSKDGTVLGADTRATEGMVVADKNCSKIHFISPNI